MKAGDEPRDPLPNDLLQLRRCRSLNSGIPHELHCLGKVNVALLLVLEGPSSRRRVEGKRRNVRERDQVELGSVDVDLW